MKEILESFVLEGLDYQQMADRLGEWMKWYQVKYRMQKWFSDNRGKGLEAARRILIKDLIEQMLKNQLSDNQILKKLGFGQGEWLPYQKGDHYITDPNRLLQYFAEQLFFSQYITKDSNYLKRMNQIYGGLTPTNYLRMLFRTGKL